MKKPLLFLLAIHALLLNAQEWAPIGTKWYYTQNFWFTDVSYPKIIESIGDTILLNTTCRVLKVTGSEYSQTAVSWLYMYDSNDSVFFYNNGSFCLLYDFNAIQEDTFDLPCFSIPNNELRVAVLNVDTITINGISRNRQFVNGDGLGYTVWGTNIKGIGNTVYMFPQGDMHYTTTIRCFEDSGGLHNFLNIPCDTVIITSERSINTDEHLTIYPNPVTDKLFVKPHTEIKYISIYNTLGQIIYTKVNGFEKGIPVNGLNKGIYFVEIQYSKNTIVRKFLKD